MRDALDNHFRVRADQFDGAAALQRFRSLGCLAHHEHRRAEQLDECFLQARRVGIGHGHVDAVAVLGERQCRQAARLALGLKARPDAQKLEKIAERWRPWRGVAARMLWSYYRGVKQRSGMALASATS